MLTEKIMEADFCVVGGGLAGLCAAISAAREGAKTVLMHERPMLGGNASSEIRMWIVGAKGKDNRETGLLEEISLESLYKNPDKSHYIFDSILLEKAYAEPNLTLLLNCSCMDAETENGIITSVKGWQMTTQSFITVKAKSFADCSGDSILAPLTGAEFRMGREAASEFGEKSSVVTEDKKTMGNSCLMQARLCDTKSRFIAPDIATKIPPEVMARRKPKMESPFENFWQLELGGEEDTIADAESLRDRLLGIALGIWDYVKNSGEVENADYWKLEFLGFLPGKRESRRMVGEYMVNQNDILSGGRFHDTVAYGGWGLDDHFPGGFFHKGGSNIDVNTPSPYGIPLRCLYSKNIKNLYFAGRNISMTHAAMSSARVMGTCALLGEAVGKAAAIGAREGLLPGEVYEKKLDELQQTLMYGDCFLPHFKRRIPEAVLSATLSASGLVSGELDNLRNGADRNNHTYGETEMGCFVKEGSEIRYDLKQPAAVCEVRVTFDSDLDRETLPGDRAERTHVTRCNLFPDSPSTALPTTLVKEFEVGIIGEDGEYRTICHETVNRRRTVFVPVEEKVKSILLKPISRHGEHSDELVHIFSFDFTL